MATGIVDPVGDVVDLSGGTFIMGTDDAVAYEADGERPARPVEVQPFSIASVAVTNERFASFVRATDHRTNAEREGWSFVFGGLLPDDFGPTRGVAAAPWWRQVVGASWQHPEGPHSSVADRLDHPVVHVSRRDAEAYCEWSGTRLPTEAEWEYAARGGLHQRRFPWGDELLVDGEHMCNIWQGDFPERNTLDDGWLGTAPVDAYPPNGFGLHNVVGNVWEWCADPFLPQGPTTGASAPDGETTMATIRGGSYLCHDSYCHRYRVSARSGNTVTSSTGNMGFRVVVR